MIYETNYLMHYNKNHDKLGRFARGVGGSLSGASRRERKIEKLKQKNQILKLKQQNQNDKNRLRDLKNVEKQKKEESDKKQNPQKEIQKKEYKYKSNLSSEDIQSRIDRINLEKKLTDLEHPTTSEGKKVVRQVLSDSGKKTATILLTSFGILLGGAAIAKKIKSNEKLLEKLDINKELVESVLGLITKHAGPKSK